MFPRNPDEMYSLMYKILVSRIYLDVTSAARRGRLTEHDIATIERKVLEFQKETDAFAGEFPGYETEPAVARAFNEMREFFAATRLGRINNVQKP